MSEQETKIEEEVTPEETPKEEVKDDNWDRERQKVDQLTANVTKIATEKAELATQLAEQAEQSKAMLEKVKGLEEQLSSAKIEQQKETEDLDPDMYDAKLIKKIEKLNTNIATTQQQLEESNKQVKTLLEAKAKQEAEAEAKAEEKRRAEAKEQILSVLDDKFGAKYRNEALKLAQAELDETGKKPEDKFGVYLLLEKHYSALAKGDSGGTTKIVSTPVDTGGGGVVFKEGDIEEGSRKDVLKQVMSKYKDKPFSMPSAG